MSEAQDREAFKCLIDNLVEAAQNVAVVGEQYTEVSELREAEERLHEAQQAALAHRDREQSKIVAALSDLLSEAEDHATKRQPTPKCYVESMKRAKELLERRPLPPAPETERKPR